MEELRKELIANCFVSIEIEAHQGGNFAEELQRAVRHRKADLIIMGIKGKSALAKAIHGSNTIKMIESKVCPI